MPRINAGLFLSFCKQVRKLPVPITWRFILKKTDSISMKLEENKEHCPAQCRGGCLDAMAELMAATCTEQGKDIKRNKVFSISMLQIK